MPSEENKKDALVSQEPESSNEALGTPAVNASLSASNIVQTQDEVNDAVSTKKYDCTLSKERIQYAGTANG